MSRRILVSRTEEDCAELAALVAGHGVEIVPFPVLSLEEVDDVSGWRLALAPDDGPSWLVMASPRAAERFVGRCAERDADRLLELPLAVIGEGTAAAASAVGLTPSIVGPGTGLGLAEILIGRWPPVTTAVFPCGHHRRSELPDALAAAGHRLLPVVVYRMRATPPADLPTIGPDIEAVVVTSPRAARLYLEGVGGRPLPCPHWALGPTTRDATRTLGIDCAIPPQPSIKSLAEELCRS
jgi:uroporphyrinogen-III synthase